MGPGGSAVTPPEHGTYARYAGTPTRPGCRCAPCRHAKAAYMADKRTRGLPKGDRRHGTRNGYDNFGCRCLKCGLAKSAATQAYNERAKEARAS